MNLSTDVKPPKENVNEDAAPWARFATDGIQGNAAALESLDRRFTELMGTLQAARDGISLLNYELRALYSTTGTPYPPVPPADNPTPPPIPPVVSKTIQIDADWSRTWGGSSYYTGGGEDTNGTYLYQGSNPEDKIGLWHFSLGEALGKKITAADMVLRNINTPYSAVVTAGFGGHSFASPPVGKPGRAYPFDVTWGRGEHKWFALPTWTYEGLSNGVLQGFSIGGIGASDANYAYFAGVGQPNPPQLRLTFEV